MADSSADLIVQRPEGLYCPPGDFYIDPWRPVARAVITHAHADHARSGHAAYLASAPSRGVLTARLGNINLQTLAYGEVIDHFSVRLSLHPAGHVLGSAQVRIEHGGQVWVASGDYKVAPDLTCAAFEPVRCHAFITESTFGLPIYRWQPDELVFKRMLAWWQGCADVGRAAMLLGYSFGKAQRMLAGLLHAAGSQGALPGAIICHGAVEPLNEAYRAEGVLLPQTQRVSDRPRPEQLKTALVVCPPSAAAGPWAKRFGDAKNPPSGAPSVAFASGWMQLRGARRRGGYDQGFVLSDHADWPGLHSAIAATGCERVIVTHGFEAVMVRQLQERGLQASSFKTEYGQDDVMDAKAPSEAGA